MGIFSKIAQGLKKTKDSFIGGLQKVFNSFTKIDEELFEQLEEQMIMSDIGVDTSVEICERVRKKVKERGITDPQQIMELIYEVISEIMGDDTGLDLTKSPAVIMVIGVNGAGKTTTIGKMCHQFKSEGKKVLVAAADTFRAAAIDQLQVWTERAGVEIVKHAEGSGPGAVVYDALEAAKARGCDVVVIDTAGRLHNKKNLMEELRKINRIIDSKAADSSREVLLVLDATTGQNAVSQAKLFSETAPITGIVLTLLGMILAVTHTSSGNPVKQFFLLLLLEIIVLTLAFGLMAYSVKKGWISRTALVEKNTAVPEGATEGTPKYKELIGKTGETITELRPVGKAKIDDKIYDVTSEDGFVDKGVGIEVVAAEGVKITVRKI